MLPYININKNDIKDMAKAKSLSTPTLAKKNTVIASRKPKPHMEMGNKVIAPMIGKNMKK